ncbi:MAG: F0F1 ATP synthase subunit delta [Bifidobacteriaceae bacterium]|jgi:F-type H+-transporting ATPase subunit delta|nr:F0F1 ATP synthase subunit delta [Bifidobacteriaceae bacterium]
MLGASAHSLAQAQKDLAQGLKSAPVQGRELADELFALVDALDSEPALARALTNPNRPAAPKEQLVRQAMAGHQADAVGFAARIATLRWSKEADLADALEVLAFDAFLTQVQQDQQLRQVEAELFEVDAQLRNHRELRTALGERTASQAARLQLVQQVFGPVLAAPTLYLLERVTGHPRGRGIRYALKFLGDLVAQKRQRLVAVVTAAVPLSSQQAEHLTKTLATEYGQDIQLNLTVDPSVVGGLRIRVGDDVVDGSLFTRLATLSRDLAA